MLKELSYLRESVRIEMMMDCRFSENYRNIVMEKLDDAIDHIKKGDLKVKP